MRTPTETRAAEIARGLVVKRNNALTTLLTGGVLGVIAWKLRGSGTPALALLFAGLFFGLFAGIVYANAFEYVLHRFLLHWGKGFLVQRHALHHDSAGAPDEARYVNFATSPWVVVLVFLLNAPPVLAVARWLDAGAATSMFVGFVIYFVLYEEIHWRIHFGGWLPQWLRFARRHHMLHHGGFAGRYSVFLPLFDWIFERHEWKRGTSVLR